MARMPTPGGDNGSWGEILNDFLSQAHTDTGSLKPDSVDTPHVRDGAITRSKASTAVQTSLDAADNAIPSSQKGAADGVATLDSLSKLATAQLPTTVATKSTNSADTGKAIDAHTGAPLLVVRASESDPPTTGEALIMGSDGRVTGGAVGSGVAGDQYRRLSGAVRDIVPVGAAVCVPNSTTTNSSATGLSVRMPDRATVDCTDLRICFSNVAHVPTTGETVPVTALTVKAAIEIGGATHLFRWRGAETLAIGPGGVEFSDPLGLDLEPGATYYLRAWINTPNTGDTYPRGMVLHGAITQPGSLSGSWQTGDDVNDTGAMSTASDTVRVPGLVGLFGRPLGPLSPIIVGIGDSILGGAFDSRTSPTINDNGGWGVGGYLKRAIAEGYSYLGTPVGSDSAVVVADATKRLRYSPLWSVATHVLEGLGYNDMSVAGGRSAEQLMADKIKLARLLNGRGISVCWATITPGTNSTDTWATTTNQTLKSVTQESRRITFNTWLRNGAPVHATSFAAMAAGTTDPAAVRIGETGHPVAAYVDVTDTIETARDSGIWKATGSAKGYVEDGVHPVAAGYDLMKVPVQSWLAGLTV